MGDFLRADVLLALSAIITSLGGILTAILSYKRTRSEERAAADADCAKRLKEARLEAEMTADELHKIRMRRALGD